MPRKREVYRNPAPGTLMKQPLGCVDLDPSTLDPDRLVLTRCREAYLAARKPAGKVEAERFTCENLKKENGRCIKGMFLYPRKWTKHKRTGKIYFHFHQGIDLGFLDPRSEVAKGRKSAAGLEIKSVTDGLVVHTHEWDGESDGYGTVIGVWNRSLGLLFWYAHCQARSLRFELGQEVHEGDTLALVGNTGNAGGAHLHFEVIDSPAINGRPTHTKVIGGPDWERELGNPRPPRLDPLEVLEKFGPWGTREVFHLNGKSLNNELAETLHRDIETSPGGYFPLGANNFWHGGVHVPMPEGSVLHAPFDATIVAARLAPDEESGKGEYGHTSFLLLKHEVSESVFEKMQRGPDMPPPPPPPAPKPRGPIGVGLPVKDPDAVNELKARLHELELYEPNDDAKLRDGKVDDELGAAIKAFQRSLDDPYPQPGRWPDGVVGVPGYTWNHLFPPEPEEPASPGQEPSTDPKRTLYCLLMHLQPMSLAAARKKEIEWVTRARLPEKTEDEQDDQDEEDSDDRAEADSHRISADVRRGSTNTQDIEWVERRLIRFEFLLSRKEPIGVVDDDLDAAIRAFQEKHPWPNKPKFWDGIVEKDAKTDKHLRMTAFELSRAKPGGSKPDKPKIDSALAAALEKVGRHGVSEVVSGLDVRVSGKEPLWLSGRAMGFDRLGRPQLKEQVHWELFSEELLVPTWTTIDDTDDDLTADVPAAIMDRVDFFPNERISVLQIMAFYHLNEAARDLRQTACRFRSEWNLHMDVAIRNIDARGLPTEGLEKALAPYQWWSHALDVLPQGVTHVWHYNPIELLRVYQEILERLKPPPPPEPKDPAHHGGLVVRVLASNGMRPKVDVDVNVTASNETTAEERIDGSGMATFHGLPKGGAKIIITEVGKTAPVVPPKAVNVLPYVITEVPIQTPLEGIPVPKGKLTVVVRRRVGGPAIGAALTIQGGDLDPDYERDRTVKEGTGTVVFSDLPPGEYRLEAVYSNPDKPDHPNERVVAAKTVAVPGKKKEWLYVLPGRCDIRLTVDDGGIPTPVTLLDEKTNVPLIFPTDGNGRAAFTVQQSRYKLTVGTHKKRINANHPELDITFD